MHTAGFVRSEFYFACTHKRTPSSNDDFAIDCLDKNVQYTRRRKTIIVVNDIAEIRGYLLLSSINATYFYCFAGI